MSESEVEVTTVKAAILEVLDMEASSVDTDTDLMGTGRMDSVAMVTLLSAIEERFEVSVPLEAIVPENFQSVRSIHRLIVETRHSC